MYRTGHQENVKFGPNQAQQIIRRKQLDVFLHALPSLSVAESDGLSLIQTRYRWLCSLCMNHLRLASLLTRKLMFERQHKKFF